MFSRRDRRWPASRGSGSMSSPAFSSTSRCERPGRGPPSLTSGPRYVRRAAAEGLLRVDDLVDVRPAPACRDANHGPTAAQSEMDFGSGDEAMAPGTRLDAAPA